MVFFISVLIGRTRKKWLIKFRQEESPRQNEAKPYNYKILEPKVKRQTIKVIILNYTEHVIIREDGGGNSSGSLGGFHGCGDRGGGLAIVAVSIILIITALLVMITATTIEPQCYMCTVLLFRIIIALVNLKGL